jgi:pyrimidine nucleoside transport protein
MIFNHFVFYEAENLFYQNPEALQELKRTSIFSVVLAHPKKINWRPVIGGAIFQFLLGIFCIRWTVGRTIFECFGDKVAAFLNFAKDGASFVFGDFLVTERNVFAFSALPTIFFFSLCISVLYYLGAMQVVLMKLGWILSSILGTTVCESVNAAGNIFLGMSEGPLIIKPYIKSLTESEIHSIMVSGFATVSGTVLAAYIDFGAEAQHLITASVMAAPASLFFSKLIFPETEESKTTAGNIKMEKSADSSVLDAASNGASQGISLILNIIANLVAFVAFIAFADGIFKWATFLLGFEDVGIQFILGKMFIPVSWAIGVDWKDCEQIGNVIGTKTIINEFVAYQRLGAYKKAGEISVRIQWTFTLLVMNNLFFSASICSNRNVCNLWLCQSKLNGNYDRSFKRTRTRTKTINHKSCFSSFHFWMFCFIANSKHCWAFDD